MANLPTDHIAIAKSLANRKGKPGRGGSVIPQIQPGPSEPKEAEPPIMEGIEILNSAGNETPDLSAISGAKTPEEAKPGTLKASLAATPAVGQMTEKAEAHQHVVEEDEVEGKVGKKMTNGDETGENAVSNAWVPTPEWVGVSQSVC